MLNCNYRKELEEKEALIKQELSTKRIVLKTLKVNSPDWWELFAEIRSTGVDLAIVKSRIQHLGRRSLSMTPFKITSITK